MTSVEKIISWLVHDFGKIWDFELDKTNAVQSVLDETPEEIIRIVTKIKSEKIVTTQNDFVLGYLLSFIYYKFMLWCGINGLHNTDQELDRFLSNLIVHTPRLKELIELVSNEKDKGY